MSFAEVALLACLVFLGVVPSSPGQQQPAHVIGFMTDFDVNGRSFSFPFVKTFSDVPIGGPLFYIDSRGRLSLGVNQGNFSTTYKVFPPAKLLIPSKAAAITPGK